jgi:hypothetical protein
MKMQPMQANLDGRLKKSRLSPKHGLWPVFEAAVNSFQAVEARHAMDGKIQVHIVRDSTQAQLAGVDAPRPIYGFRITDNGQGFTPENFKSFETYDSPYKFAQGGKGIGRLLFLVAFDEAKIDSYYKSRDEIRHRSFRFTVPANGISDMTDEKVEAGAIGTVVELIGFKKQYCDATDSNAAANTDEISSIVIVELKRPQRDDFDNEENPILQVFEYIENIRSGKAHKPDGVAIDIKPQIPFFIYIVADATPTLKKQIQHANIFTPTPDAGGYFGYAKDYNAYIEIMSFEKLIRDAEKKNFVWFKHLGIS